MLCCPVALRALMAAVLWESNTLSIKYTCLFQRLQSTNTNTFLLKALTLKCLLWSKIIPRCVTGSHLRVLQFLLLLHWVYTKKERANPFWTLHSLKIPCNHFPSAIQYFGTVNLSHLPPTKCCFLSKFLPYALSLQFLIIYANHCPTPFPLASVNIALPHRYTLQSGITGIQWAACSRRKHLPISLTTFEIRVLSPQSFQSIYLRSSKGGGVVQWS